MIGKLTEEYDLNSDGKVTPDEVLQSKELLELELREEKAEAHKKMSWITLIIMVVVTIALLSPFISDSRVSALADLLGMFYISCASIIGFYFGSTTWLSINK